MLFVIVWQATTSCFLRPGQAFVHEKMKYCTISSILVTSDRREQASQRKERKKGGKWSAKLQCVVKCKSFFRSSEATQ